MSTQEEAVRVYQFLVGTVLKNGERPKTTYGEVSSATRVPMGEHGGHIGRVLGIVQRACAQRGLPPLSSIVVRPGVGEIPGPGYFDDLANIASEGNPANWEVHKDILEQWGSNARAARFDKDIVRWNLGGTKLARNDLTDGL
jgi:hypothetical protein